MNDKATFRARCVGDYQSIVVQGAGQCIILVAMTTDAAAAQHVTRTLRALELLAARPQTQADIARELEVHRRTARRLLARLADEGYVREVQQGQHSAFEPTAQLILLGKRVADRLDLSAIGTRLLAAAEIDGVEGWYLTFVDRQGLWFGSRTPPATERASRVAEPRQRRESLHAQADGKIFLSADTSLLDEVLNQGLLAYTSKTMTTRGDLLLELATVRSNRYATEQYEHDSETQAIASPVRDHAGRITACITAILDSESDPDQVSPDVCAIADAFTTELGGQPRGDD